jgi:acyl-coenzyme A thioesterase PaaI-like protein
MGVTHGGALMTFMDYCMAATIWDYTQGKNAYTIELNNKFVRPARLDRWLFGEIKIVNVDDTISLEGRINANDPGGMLVLQSTGKFSLPKEIKTVDSTD